MNSPDKQRRFLTLEQEIQQLQDKLNRKLDEKRRIDDGQKFVIGGMMLRLAQQDKAVRGSLLDWMNAHITRPADLKRIQPLLDQWANPTATEGEKKKF